MGGLSARHEPRRDGPVRLPPLRRLGVPRPARRARGDPGHRVAARGDAPARTPGRARTVRGCLGEALGLPVRRCEHRVRWRRWGGDEPIEEVPHRARRKELRHVRVASRPGHRRHRPAVLGELGRRDPVERDRPAHRRLRGRAGPAAASDILTGRTGKGKFRSISPHSAAATDRLLAGRVTYPPNRRLLQHLRTERPALFTCVRRADVEATNWQAEQAIRPAVVTRKVCGGNRSPRGAATQAIVASVLRTSVQQHRDPLVLLVALQRSPRPIVADLRLPGPAPPT
ncbi:MAG: hypothetical protein E6J56_23760 [Deltaproteobacteria bacterium]|nr:MAG: hypothetical protein E6J56_23760 [Deltaproteobacteria bacterium]